MKKGVLSNILLYISMLIFGATSVSAQFTFPEPVKDLLKVIFIDLPGSSQETLTYTIRFFLFLIAFSISYGPLKKTVFKDAEGKGGAVITSFVLGLLVSIGVPTPLLITLYKTYSLIFSIVLIFLPFMLGFYLNKKVFKEDGTFDHLMRGMIYLLIAYVTGTLLASAATGGDPFELIYSYGIIGVIIAVIAGIINLFGAFGGGDGSIFSRRTPDERESIRAGKEEKRLEDVANTLAGRQNVFETTQKEVTDLDAVSKALTESYIDDAGKNVVQLTKAKEQIKILHEVATELERLGVIEK